MKLPKRAAAELIGTAFLLAAIVGSGIMAERLAGGNAAIALLANALATAAALVALISTFGPLSGAHFNPLVSVLARARGELSSGDVLAYATAQIVGAMAGVALAHVMFDLAWPLPSQHVRAGVSQAISETVATFGLVVVVGTLRNATAAPFIVASYIGSAYWFTSSTSFANPAVTLARATTDTFAGIRPVDVPWFLAAQAAGFLAAALTLRWLLGPAGARSELSS